MSPSEKYEWNHQVVDALTHYRISGEIREILYQGFDQEGTWIGLHKRGTWEKFPEEATEKLAHESIPPEKLVKTNKHGEKTLLSAYYDNSFEGVRIDFRHVMGKIQIPNSHQLRAPHLKSTESIYANKATILFIPNLKDAENIDIQYVDALSAPKLETLGGNLYAFHAATVDLPKLRSIGSYFNARDAIQVSAPKLEQIVESYLHLPTATSINMPALKSVGGYLDTQKAPDFYKPRIIIGGEIRFHPDAKGKWEKRQAIKTALKDQNVLEI